MLPQTDADLALQYKCVVFNTNITAKACSNREIAVKQWMSSMITENPPAALKDKHPKNNTVVSWNNSMNATEYSYFYDKYKEAFTGDK